MTINEPQKNIECEQQVLGALIKDPTHSNSRETIDTFAEDDFFKMAHRLIFNEIKSMSERKENIDLITLENNLSKKSDQYGGFVYLAELNKNTIGTANLPAYVKVVKKCSQLRKLSTILAHAAEMINQGGDPVEITEAIDNDLKDAAVSSSGAELRHINTVEGDWLDRLDERMKQGGAFSGLSTGIDELDERINGIGEESLVIVAGAPSMGKTLFCQTLAANIGVDQK